MLDVLLKAGVLDAFVVHGSQQLAWSDTLQTRRFAGTRLNIEQVQSLISALDTCGFTLLKCCCIYTACDTTTQ